jgi:transposase
VKTQITYIGIDAHKKSHSICILHPNGEKEEAFTVNNQKSEIKKVLKKLQKRMEGEIRICYEAGPIGFDLQRTIQSLGIHCDVIAPSLIPKKPGERIKTDKRDAKKLATLYQAGLLTVVHPPTPEEENARDLCRCRRIAKVRENSAKHQLGKFLLRHGRYYSEGNAWTQKYFRWLRTLSFEDAIEKLVFEDYLLEVEHCINRVKILDQELAALSQTERYKEKVGWLCCFRGIDTVTAISLICELYGVERFTDARQLMSYLGLVPSENSSGGQEKKGPITKAGNKYCRRLAVESSWHYRHSPRVSGPLAQRRKGQPPWVIAIADKAMKRLSRKYNRMTKNGKHKNVAVTAMARELIGFVWAVLFPAQAAEGKL